MTFRKDEVTQRNGDTLGYFLLKHFFFIFTYISSLKVRFVFAGIFKFQKWFDVDILDFQIEL